ncbi:MAG: class II histone deacetylase [Steroidobacteraceae bacterium]|jgi:acetoin utilization deacetylase AcuC-like enzyme|nr:class II histone deacetylase [Steroidobacteraceae bacterium]
MTTALIWDERYFWYEFGDYRSLMGDHPWLQPGSYAETPDSKRRILNLLHASGLLDHMTALQPVAVTESELCCFHDAAYVRRVRELSANGGGVASRGAPVPAGGYEIAALAVGGVKTAIDAVLRGAATNAYALVRPPGHHAERDHGAGLCIFANAAVATRLAMREHGLHRVAIVDWDAHHGNGTESAFYDDPSVLTISIHQDLVIPGRGAVRDCGRDEGEGYNINVPLPPGSGTGAYLAAMDRVVAPALRRFRPELILVASGVDACASDPTARMLLHADSYRFLTARLMGLAAELCAGRLVMTHEGGYDPSATPFCALAIMEEMSGIRTPVKDPFGELREDALTDYQRLLPHQDDVIRQAEALLALMR